jgi:hypothetical protein
MTKRSGWFDPRVVLLLGCVWVPAAADAAPITTEASGLLAADIQTEVDAFRAALGEPNNGNAPGPLAGGRREINWDGGGATTPSVVGTPFTGFENIRGATMTTPGSGFIQAAPADLATQFGNPSLATTFAAFSPLRLFAPIQTNVTDVTFSIPGTNGAVPATVSAFGAVFSDVDTDATTMEFFDASDASLGTFDVPSLAGDATFSFLGVLFDAGEQISRVRITTGNFPLSSFEDDDVYDLVVMDDFLYAEPVPEPGTLALIALGLAGIARLGRPRSQ